MVARHINPEGLHRSPAFSQAVVVEQPAKTIYIGGQNGVDADVYYPRLDRRERAPRRVSQIDQQLAQDLVDRFVRAGAQIVFVGPSTGLHGPAGVVQVLVHHDDHLHVRLPPA